MLGIYIHIPFCVRKCKYCDFNSFSAREEEKEKYLDALFTEMDEYHNVKADTIFIGGGTPTALSNNQLKRLTDKIKATFIFAENIEYTVEANPKTVDREKLEILKNGGVNRVSIGVQSFCDSELSMLGRIHSSEDAKETIGLLREAGFSNVNMDLMCAIPSQTVESFKKNLDTAISLSPEHISCYSLILEEETPLYEEVKAGKLSVPDEETDRDIYELACRELEKNGYMQYEISNFAKKGFESRHNLKYWNCDEYIGIGLSAHSYKDGIRFSNTDFFSEYISGVYKKEETERLSVADKMSEFMFLGLRKTEGVSKNEFEKRFGKTIENVFKEQINKFKANGFLTEENGYIHLSHNGISVSNQIMCEFLL